MSQERPPQVAAGFSFQMTTPPQDANETLAALIFDDPATRAALADMEAAADAWRPFQDPVVIAALMSMEAAFLGVPFFREKAASGAFLGVLRVPDFVRLSHPFR